MGKKRIISQSEEELLKEKDKLESALKKEVKVKSPLRSKEGRIYIFSSYNNTIINITDSKGNVLTWASAGAIGFKGAKKSTPFAASKVGDSLAEKALTMGIKEVDVVIRGVGPGREPALRGFMGRGIEISSIHDSTPIPHNGPKLPKPRRV